MYDTYWSCIVSQTDEGPAPEFKRDQILSEKERYERQDTGLPLSSREPDPVPSRITLLNTINESIQSNTANEYKSCQNPVIILRPTRRINQSVRKSISNLKCTSSRRVRHYDNSKMIGTKSRSERTVAKRYHRNRIIVGNLSNNSRVRTLAHQRANWYQLWGRWLQNKSLDFLGTNRLR